DGFFSLRQGLLSFVVLAQMVQRHRQGQIVAAIDAGAFREFERLAAALGRLFVVPGPQMGEGAGMQCPGNVPIGSKSFSTLDKVRGVAYRLRREDASVEPAEGVIVRRRGDKLLFLADTA